MKFKHPLKQQSGHAGLMFVMIFPALFGMFVWATDGARILQSEARLTDAMEVATLAVAAAGSTNNEVSKSTAKQFVSGYFPDVPSQDIIVSMNDPKEMESGATRYTLDVSIKRKTLFDSGEKAYGKDFTIGRTASSMKGVLQEPIDLILVADYSGSMADEYGQLQATIKDIADKIKESNDKIDDPDKKSRIAVVGYDMYTAENTPSGKIYRSNVYCTVQFGIDENCKVQGQFIRELLEPKDGNGYNKWSRTTFDYRLEQDYKPDYGPLDVDYGDCHRWGKWESWCRDNREREAREAREREWSNLKDFYTNALNAAERSGMKVDIGKTIANVFNKQKTVALARDDGKPSATFENINLTTDVVALKNKIDTFNVPNPGANYLAYPNGRQRYYSPTAFYAGMISAAQMANDQGSMPRRMIIMLSDGEDTFQEVSEDLVEAGLCSSIQTYLNSQTVPYDNRNVPVQLSLSAIGFGYNVKAFPAINDCVGSDNVYKANNISAIKDQVMTLISEETGTLIR